MSITDREPTISLAESMAALFPLRLTALEEFMVADGRPDYPMMCDVEFEVQGVVDREAFESALTFALARNPLFTCVVEPAGRAGLAWVPSGRRPSVRWVTLDDPLDDRYGAPIDLTCDIGLRIWVRQGTERAGILLHFHHACSDAMGSFAFIEDWLVGYANSLSGNEEIAPRPIDPTRLLGRGEVGIPQRPIWRRLLDSAIGAREGAKFFLQAPLPLVGADCRSTVEQATADRATAGPPLLTAECPEATTAALRRLASREQATLNDILLRDLFLSLRRWNADHGQMPRRRRLRILMPQNLREREDNATPAANVMSFAFVTRRARDCESPPRLLQSIREETAAVRRGKLSLYFLGGLETIRNANLLPRVLHSSLCFSTTVLTNFGDITRRFTARFPRTSGGLAAGNLVFRGVRGAPPLRPRTRVAFSVSSTAGTFSISLKWDAGFYTRAEAQSLLDLYMAELRATADSAPATTVATPPR